MAGRQDDLINPLLSGMMLQNAMNPQQAQGQQVLPGTGPLMQYNVADVLNSLAGTNAKKPQQVPQMRPQGMQAVKLSGPVMPNIGQQKEYANEFMDEVQANPSIINQKRGLATAEQALEDYKQKVNKGEIDFSGLMALTDAWTGSKFSNSYKKPLTAAEKQANVIALEDAVQKRREGVSGNENDLFKTYMANKALTGQLSLAKSAETNSRFLTRQHDDYLKQIHGTFTKETSKLPELQAGFGVADANLAAGDYQSVMATLSNVARNVGMEKGPLNEDDVKRTIPSTWANSLAELELKLTSGPVPADPAIVNGLKKLVARGKANIAGSMKKRLEQQRGMYAARMPDLFQPYAPGQAMFEQTMQYVNDLSPAQLEQQQQEAPSNLPSFKAWKGR